MTVTGVGNPGVPRGSSDILKVLISRRGRQDTERCEKGLRKSGGHGWLEGWRKETTKGKPEAGHALSYRALHSVCRALSPAP
jgi:hypothetical protein